MREDMRKGIRSRVFEFAEYDENAVNGKILVPDCRELVKQAAFYRKQNNNA